MSNIQKMIGILGFVVVLVTGIQNASADCPTFPTGFTCKCNGDDTRWVCAAWDAPGEPTEGFDFTVTYDGDIPEVQFVNADDGWVIYSEVLASGVPTGPAAIGAIVLTSDVDPNSGDFHVTIKNGAGAGALDVSSIVLDSSDGDWTGGSTLNSSWINGDVAGDITLNRIGDSHLFPHSVSSHFVFSPREAFERVMRLVIWNCLDRRGR